MPEELINKRQSSHGNWDDQAYLAQVLKIFVRCELSYDDLSYTQREAVDNILTKISRIVCGDPNFKDHWDDISGYALLGGGTRVKKTRKRSRSKDLRDGEALA